MNSIGWLVLFLKKECLRLIKSNTHGFVRFTFTWNQSAGVSV
jgi:hypothetical protein